MIDEAQPVSVLLGKLWRHVSSRRRKQFAVLILLMSLVSFAEIVSIGAVLPFLGVLTSPDTVFQHALTQPLIRAFGLSRPDQLVLPLTMIFGLAAAFAGLMRLLLLWASTRLAFATGADLSISIYLRTLYQPYSVHTSRNSSAVITAISSKVFTVINGMIMPMVTILSSSFMITGILIALVTMDSLVALLAMAGFAFVYLGIVGFTRRRLLRNSQHVAIESTQVVKSLQEGLGGIRDVLIDGSQEVYAQIYHRADVTLRRAQGNNTFISQSPRFVMEAAGMMLIAALAYSLAQAPGGIATAIPVLGALALGAQRMLPALQQAYAAWSGIQGGRASLQDTLELLDQPLPDYAGGANTIPLPFEREIQLRQVSFRYSPEAPWVLRQLDLSIKKGSRVGFIGVTGSGKSTLLDIVMGLLQPPEGNLLIDGKVIELANHRQWQAHIAHVPQTIFLADTTIEANIAFGEPLNRIDKPRVRWAAEQAQLASLIESWPEQYNTFVGERGVRLSGGQRQRIGIARALYKKVDVIILDEATSALDSETEKAIMQAIEALGQELTVLMVAHRLSTLRDCSRIVEIADGAIKRSGTFEEIVSQAA